MTCAKRRGCKRVDRVKKRKAVKQIPDIAKIRKPIPVRRRANEIQFVSRTLQNANDALSDSRCELRRLRIEIYELRRLGSVEKELRRVNRALKTSQVLLGEKDQDCKVLSAVLCIAREDNAKLNAEAAMAPRPWNYMRKF
jgi:hypothetical protein